jgi:hypothetical protein
MSSSYFEISRPRYFSLLTFRQAAGRPMGRQEVEAVVAGFQLVEPDHWAKARSEPVEAKKAGRDKSRDGSPK